MITLTSGIHDPHAGLEWLSDKHMKDLHQIFDAVVITASNKTNKKYLTKLKRQSGRLSVELSNNIGHKYYDVLRHGHVTNGDTIFLCDFDRILHWVHNHPRELRRAVAHAKRHPYVVNERTLRGYRGHHAALYETEQLPNKIISLAMEEKTQRDYLSGSWSFSREAASILIKKGHFDSFAFIGAWPMLLKNAGIKAVYKQWHGLDWETPNQHRDDVKRCGGVAKFRTWFSSPAEWEKRVRMSQEFADAILPKLK